MKIYKTSFNGLKIEEKGIYSAYNLSPEELESFRKKFCNHVNGSGSNYTAFDKAERHVWMNLLVHDLWIPIRFDIRSDILKITKSSRIYKNQIEQLSKRIKENRLQLKVLSLDPNEYNLCEEDFQEFLKLLESLLKK